MNNLSLMAPSANRLATVVKDVKVQGMVVAQTKTGAQKVQLLSKKLFMDGWKKKNPDASNKQAANAFNAYRVATLKQFALSVGTAILAGHIVPERVNADASGDLRTISLARNKRVTADQEAEALARTSAITGIPVEQLVKAAKEHGSAINVSDVTDIEVGVIGNGDGAVKPDVQDNRGGNNPGGNNPEGKNEGAAAEPATPPAPITTAGEPTPGVTQVPPQA